MEHRSVYEMNMEEDLKESINEHIKLIKNLSSLSNVQLIVFVNTLSIDNPEIFGTLKEVTEWESKILSEFMKESEQPNEEKKKETKKKPQKATKKEPKKKPKELKRASDDMFEKSQYDRVQIGGEKNKSQLDDVL
jgi:hypothetical protein